jgi:hypothetical protein
VQPYVPPTHSTPPPHTRLHQHRLDSHRVHTVAVLRPQTGPAHSTHSASPRTASWASSVALLRVTSLTTASISSRSSETWGNTVVAMKTIRGCKETAEECSVDRKGKAVVHTCHCDSSAVQRHVSRSSPLLESYTNSSTWQKKQCRAECVVQ